MSAKWLILITFVFLMLFMFIGCVIGGDESNADIVKSKGMVVYISIEGGFYGIIDEYDNKYEPINLASDFEVDSLKVSFEGKLLKDQNSIHMWGTLIELTKITKL